MHQETKTLLLFDLEISLLKKLTDRFMCKDVHMFTVHNGKITEAAENMQINDDATIKKKKTRCKHKCTLGFKDLGWYPLRGSVG